MYEYELTDLDLPVTVLREMVNRAISANQRVVSILVKLQSEIREPLPQANQKTTTESTDVSETTLLRRAIAVRNRDSLALLNVGLVEQEKLIAYLRHIKDGVQAIEICIKGEE